MADWLVGIIGLAVVIAGIVLIIEGVRAKFMRLLEIFPDEHEDPGRGQAARYGRHRRPWRQVLALAGALVVEAAVKYQPSKARGLDKALLTLRHQPFGEFLLVLAGLGLIIFGVYALCEARWHKV